MKIRCLITVCDVKYGQQYDCASITYDDYGLPTHATIVDNVGEQYVLINRGNITGEAYDANEFEVVSPMERKYKVKFRDQVNGEKFHFTITYEVPGMFAAEQAAVKEFPLAEIIFINRVA